MQGHRLVGLVTETKTAPKANNEHSSGQNFLSLARGLLLLGRARVSPPTQRPPAPHLS